MENKINSSQLTKSNSYQKSNCTYIQENTEIYDFESQIQSQQSTQVDSLERCESSEPNDDKQNKVKDCQQTDQQKQIDKKFKKNMLRNFFRLFQKYGQTQIEKWKQEINETNEGC
ncbi:hypothetical protein PPERSA_02497 [Pseudocohnilembus persalinus]|uniref:Uncharacterized protein n=1 Tax=Pseudocohnilembus persalinus TaxID=266149 RepID=A0A0V0QAX7_PSEPJ|nr:hypothetical protein PPERSA_02497 [Pseudocohnilembus persalinus]|eukprot:KRW99385.1 hypothetical protein PPERSA_02497 [Pseudocohnilembus persalinus]